MRLAFANDAFTYLAHGNWLQTHCILRLFSDAVRPDDIKA
jgi:hypothetical protein